MKEGNFQGTAKTFLVLEHNCMNYFLELSNVFHYTKFYC